MESSFEGHHDESITIFSDSGQSPEHTGCHVTMEVPDLSEDEREYRSSSSSDEETNSEPIKTKDLGKPFHRIVRQSKGGRNRMRKGGSDD